MALVEGSLTNETFILPLPKDQGSPWEMEQKSPRQGGWKQNSLLDMTGSRQPWTRGSYGNLHRIMTAMDTWQLWQPAQDQLSAFQGGVRKRSLSTTLTEEDSAMDGFWEKGRQGYFLLKIIVKIL